MPSCKVTIRMPGFVGVTGGETIASDAAIYGQPGHLSSRLVLIPMPLILATKGFSSTGSGVSFLRADEDVDRLPSGFLRGPKCVSLNSVLH